MFTFLLGRRLLGVVPLSLAYMDAWEPCGRYIELLSPAPSCKYLFQSQSFLPTLDILPVLLPCQPTGQSILKYTLGETRHTKIIGYYVALWLWLYLFHKAFTFVDVFNYGKRKFNDWVVFTCNWGHRCIHSYVNVTTIVSTTSPTSPSQSFTMG